MLRLECPHCGVRDETEFRYGGDAGVRRPARQDPAVWARYLFWRRNDFGEREELWLHVSGCRRWLRVRRDTRNNRVLRVADARAPGSPPA
jgi:methylglutamate dehydrogenase subunit B